MADQALERDRAALRDAIAALSSPAFKNHMLAALEAFVAPTGATPTAQAATAPATQPDDKLVNQLREKSVQVQCARDALFAAVHALLVEAGFQTQGQTEGGFALPSGWDATSANGLFTAKYTHPNDASIQFAVQALFVGNRLEVYISDDKQHTHTIELITDKYVKSDAGATSGSVAAADVLQDVVGLRAQFAPFAESVKPARKVELQETREGLPSFHPLGPRSGPEIPAPYGIPSVGGGDVLPPGLGGGNPDMLVGPDHPMFGRRGDPFSGPVPGARFDPFGPPGPGGFGRPPPRFGGPAPNLPFGDPNPDHLRMPGDNDMDPGFGYGRRGGGGGGGDPFSRPFGSDNSFF